MRICFRAYPGGEITICHHIQVPDRLIFLFWFRTDLSSLVSSGSVAVLVVSVQLGHYLRWVGLSPPWGPNTHLVPFPIVLFPILWQPLILPNKIQKGELAKKLHEP